MTYVMHHISGTVQHVIMIFGILAKMIPPVVVFFFYFFFFFFFIFIFQAVTGGAEGGGACKRAKIAQNEK